MQLVILLIMMVGCSKPLITNVEFGSDYCNEEANRLGITGEFYCDFN